MPKGNNDINHSKIRIPREMNKLMRKLFIIRLGEKYYQRDYYENEEDVIKVWSYNDIEYHVDYSYLYKMKTITPKMYVAQDKNIKLIIYLTQVQQFKNDIKKAEVTFTLKEYAKYRGYEPEDIDKGWIFTELKKDIYSGAFTSYKIGDEYYNPFYKLYEPKKRKGKWRIVWNSPYDKQIIEILKTKSKGYLLHALKEVTDRITTDHPLLHSFYNDLVHLRQKKGQTMQMKISTLFNHMNVNDHDLRLNKKCIDILYKCYYYFTKNYSEELTGMIISEIYKSKREYTISGLSRLSDEEFQESLFKLNIDNLKEAFISFYLVYDDDIDWDAYYED